MLTLMLVVVVARLFLAWSLGCPPLSLSAAMVSVLNVIIVHGNGTVFAVTPVILTIVAQVIAAAMCNVAAASWIAVAIAAGRVAAVATVVVGCSCSSAIVIIGTCGSIKCLYMILYYFARKLTMLAGLICAFVCVCVCV